MIVILSFNVMLIHIKHRHDISVLNIINNRPSIVLLPLKVPPPRDEFECIMFLYLFIPSFTYSYFFYYYLFVSLYLIYINHVWHFCLKSFNNSPACIYFHSKCLTRKIEFWMYYVYCIYCHSFTYSYFFLYYYLLFHLI